MISPTEGASPLDPQNIHCLALNYSGVGTSNETPLNFVKSRDSLCFSGSTVPYPRLSKRMWTEVELTIVLGKPAQDLQDHEIYDHIAGFTVGADITCENLHGRDHHLAFSKSRRNFCPLQNRVVQLSQEDLPRLGLCTEINGRITQRGHSRDMIFDPLRATQFISQLTPLYKGDVILTGTPSGVENNTLQIGDKVRHIIEMVGDVEFEVVAP